MDEFEARPRTQCESQQSRAVGTIASQGGERSSDDDSGLSDNDLSDEERMN